MTKTTTVNKRAGWIAEIERLTAELERTAPTVRATERDALAELVRARAVRDTAEMRWREARTTAAGAITSIESRISRLKFELAEDARPLIEGFAGELRDAQTWVRGHQRNFDDFGVAAMTTIRAAQEELDGLAVTATTHEQIEQRIAALRQATGAYRR